MTQPPAPSAPAAQDPIVKRLRYYYGEFLQADDFTDEQQYHIGQRQRLAQLLATPGVLEGLNIITQNQPSGALLVTKGTAVDGLGRLIVLASDQSFPVTGAPTAASTTMILTIAYAEQPSDLAADEPKDDTRWSEIPALTLVDPSSDQAHEPDTYIQLAQLSFAQGAWDGQADPSVRATAGLRTGGQANVGGNLTVGGTLGVTGLLTASGGLTVSGGELTVSQNATVSGTLGVAGLLTASGGLTVSGGPLTLGVAVTAFSTDGTLAANSNANVPTEQAVKSYVDGAIQKLGITEGTDLSNYTLKSDFNGLKNAVDEINGSYLSKDAASNTYATLSSLSQLSGTVDGKADKGGDPSITFVAGTISTKYLYAELAKDNLAGISLKCEHIGSNFMVRPTAASSTVTVIENTGGGGLSIQPDGANVVFGGSVSVNSNLSVNGDWVFVYPKSDGAGMRIIKRLSDSQDDTNAAVIELAAHQAQFNGAAVAAEGYCHIQSTSRAGTAFGALKLNPNGGNVTVAGNNGVSALIMQTCAAAENRNATTVPGDVATALGGMPANTVLFGGCKDTFLYFYWCDDNHTIHTATLEAGVHIHD